jgi:hypothetical protein
VHQQQQQQRADGALDGHERLACACAPCCASVCSAAAAAWGLMSVAKHAAVPCARNSVPGSWLSRPHARPACRPTRACNISATDVITYPVPQPTSTQSDVRACPTANGAKGSAGVRH